MPSAGLAGLTARLAVVVVAVGSIIVFWRLDNAHDQRIRALRARFLLGVPWGTLLAMGFVLGIYLFVQGGLADWNAPLVIPFRAWSYFYPLGVLTAPFSHASSGHLVGNLVGTLAFAPIAEFAWSHYPPGENGRMPTSAGRRSTLEELVRPVGRVLAFFVGTLVVGLLTSVFALGPIVGFSGVVFAFAGMALVRHPLATVLALAADGVVRLVYASLINPVTVASASPSFGAPAWAQIAIQGHAVGLLCGVLCGILVGRRRSEHTPAPFHLFAGVLVFAVGQSLWAVYWYRGGETYVLFRALGAVLVFALAGLVALAVSDAGVPSVDRLRPGFDFEGSGLSARRLATAVLIAALLGLAMPAVPVNLVSVDRTAGTPMAAAPGSSPGGPSISTGVDRPPSSGVSGPSGVSLAAASVFQTSANGSNVSNGSNRTLGRVVNGSVPGGAVAVRGYTIQYAEDVPNELVSVIDISAFGETTAVNTSGAIVTNEKREIWTMATSTSRLAFAGRTRVRVGGLGWERAVGVRRGGWTLAGGNTTYRVLLDPPNGTERLAFGAPRAIATPVIDGRQVAIEPTTRGFALAVTRSNRSLGRAPVPAMNESVTVGGLTVERQDGRLLATRNSTTVPIATRESYAG
jgi:membrane associated rhomboid family serine protease